MAVLLLTGCPGTAVTSDGVGLSSSVGIDGDRVPSIPIPRPRVKPPAQPLIGGPTPDAAATVPGAEDAIRQAVARTNEHLSPDTIVGLNRGQTRHLFGAPMATEDEPPAQVWRYTKGACTMKVFFFMDMTSQDYRALSYDVQSNENVPDVDQRCFAQLLVPDGDPGHE
jgi:hypothetical protein